MARKPVVEVTVMPDPPEVAGLVIAAERIGCHISDLIKWRQLPDGSLVVIGPNGRKHLFTPAMLDGNE